MRTEEGEELAEKGENYKGFRGVFSHQLTISVCDHGSKVRAL